MARDLIVLPIWELQFCCYSLSFELLRFVGSLFLIVCVSVLKGGERLEKNWLGWLVGGAKKPEVRI